MFKSTYTTLLTGAGILFFICDVQNKDYGKSFVMNVALKNILLYLRGHNPRI